VDLDATASEEFASDPLSFTSSGRPEPNCAPVGPVGTSSGTTLSIDRLPWGKERFIMLLELQDTHTYEAVIASPLLRTYK